MRVLIYGASGLIGMNLTKRFSEKSDVLKVCLVASRKIPELFLRELNLDRTKIEIYSEISDLNLKFDLIFHCGFSSQPGVFLNDPTATIQKNLCVAPKLVNLLSPTGSIFFMSSSEIYNGCKVMPCDETHFGLVTEMGDRLNYILTKYQTENLISELVSQTQKYYIIRVSLVYGPGVFLSDTRVLYKFVREAKNGLIKIEGSTDSIRRYLYVDDFIESLIQLEGKISGVYNIGGITPITILELAELISKILPSRVKISSSLNTTTLSAPKDVNISMKKISDQINFSPKIDLEDGLVQVVKWMKIFEN